MKKLLFGLGLLCSASSFGQASAEQTGGQVVFEKSNSCVGLNGFSVENTNPV